MLKYDHIIRNCRVINGSGSPWFRSDVAISGDTIAAVGQLDNCIGINEIEANNAYLTPGFIDSHTHDDIALLLDPRHKCKLMQGVTTVVTGNCSFSNYPNNNSANYTKQHLSSLLGEIKSEHICEDYNSYINLLTSNGVSVNVVSLVGHGPIRINVMKGYHRRNASDSEIKQMCELLEQQLIQGSAGLSLGFMYPPSSFADRNELLSLAKVVKKYDRIVAAHIRCYGKNVFESIEEFISILKESRVKGLLSHLQIAGPPYWGQMQKAIDMIENSRKDGIDISFDMYPYTAGSSTILQLLPPNAIEGGVNTLIEKLNDKDYYENLRYTVENGVEADWESKVKLCGWDKFVIGGVTDQSLKKLEGKTMSQSANELSMNCFDFMVHVIRIDFGTTNIIMFQQSDEDQKTVHSSRLQMVGSDGIPRSGGKPHPRLFGTFPRVIGKYCLRDGLIDLEESIRRMTSLTAHRFQMFDRGLIIPGLKADLVLFNDKFIDNADYETPQQYPDGLISVWVNGKQVVNKGMLCDKPLNGIMIKL